MNMPIQAAPVMRGNIPVHQTSALVQQGCNPFECAGVVASCVAACVGGVTAPACIACLGSAYASCRDCF